MMHSHLFYPHHFAPSIFSSPHPTPIFFPHSDVPYPFQSPSTVCSAHRTTPHHTRNLHLSSEYPHTAPLVSIIACGGPVHHTALNQSMHPLSCPPVPQVPTEPTPQLAHRDAHITCKAGQVAVSSTDHFKQRYYPVLVSS